MQPGHKCVTAEGGSVQQALQLLGDACGRGKCVMPTGGQCAAGPGAARGMAGGKGNA